MSILLTLILVVLFTCSVAEHLADSVIDAVDTALGRGVISWDRTYLESVRMSDFKHFVSIFIRNASVEMPILLVTLVYIRQAKLRLRIESDQWAYERVFLGALIVASKVRSSSIHKGYQHADHVLRSSISIPESGTLHGSLPRPPLETKRSLADGI